MSSSLRRNNRVRSRSLTDRGQKRAQQKKIIIISAVVCAVAIVILIAAITRNVSRSHDNSFDYQVKQAKAAYSAGNINSAVSYYEGFVD